jgi:hypothetical protein
VNGRDCPAKALGRALEIDQLVFDGLVLACDGSDVQCDTFG